MALRRPTLPAQPFVVRIEHLNWEGRGVAHVQGRRVLVDGGLAKEDVEIRLLRRRRTHDDAVVSQVLKPARERVAAGCVHFSVCGGCSLQHLHAEAQVALKEQHLLQCLWQYAQLEPERLLPPLTGARWGYRRKARLGVKYVPKKGGVLVGFREKHSGHIAELSRCEVLHASVGYRIDALRALLTGLEARDRIPQVEIAVGETATALVIRHLNALGAQDQQRLREFAERHDVDLYLQPGGADTVAPFWPPQSRPLSYRLSLPQRELALRFEPTEFIQVHAGINRDLVARVVGLLAPGPHERVLDLFCGLGNFTLALAHYAGHVTGLDVSSALIARARENAQRNGVCNVAFHSTDLSSTQAMPQIWETWHKLVLDPPRSGAQQVCEALAAPLPSRIVYISCNPTTLARDAGILVHKHGLHMTRAGVVDMFPHTSHVESVALFECT